MVELAVRAKGVDASELARELLVNLCAERAEGKGVIIVPDVLVELGVYMRALYALPDALDPS